MNLQYKIEKSGRLVNVELLSGRTAVVSSPAAFVDEVVENKEFKLISYEGQIDFKLNQELEFKLGVIKSKFNIQQIDKDKIPGRYYLSCSKINLNSWFILPLLASDSRQNRDWFGWNNYMINSYLDNSLKKVILVYRFFPNNQEIIQTFGNYSQQESNLMGHETYLEFIDPTTYTVAYVFHLKEIHFKDIEMFSKGKYSSISDVGQRKIINFHNTASPEIKLKLKDILTKSSSRKKELESKFGMILPDNIDLHEMPDLSKEIYEH